MDVTTIRGLKFPDDYVVRFFFKQGMHTWRGRVLELGCGSGNNLLLFHQYGWGVVGVDADKTAVVNARHNLRLVDTAEAESKIMHRDISSGLGGIEGPFDVVLMPNIVCYVSRRSARRIMAEAATVSAPGAHVFLRTRGLGDYRYGRGKKTEPNGFELETRETGEFGALNVFYREHELVEMLCGPLGVDPSTMKVLSVNFQNVQGDIIVSNHDIVIWGQRRA